MRRLAVEPRDYVQQIRAALTAAAIADLVWSMNSPEYYPLITSRGWTPGQYAATVRDGWIRTLLRHPLPGRATEDSASSPWLPV